MKAAILLRALRVNQWTKNALVLAPLCFAFGDRTQAPGLTLRSGFMAVAAMAVFCLVSSAIYVFNDLSDLEADRAHPKKKFRPLASGELSLSTGRLLCIALLAAGIGAAMLLGVPAFAGVIAAYVAMQIVYTLILKHIALVDAFVIAIGFVMRALSGALILQVTISPWLLLCTFLLALFLALCKRRHEKIVLDEGAGSHRVSLDSYSVQLLDQLIAIVSAATIISYAIYTLWPETLQKFGTYQLGLTIPFVIFGIFRYLDLVYRHEQGGRPEKILLTDIPLLVNLALYGVTVFGVFYLRA